MTDAPANRDDVEEFLSASRCCERWPYDVQTTVVFFREGTREYARNCIQTLQDAHRRFGGTLHAWRETVTSVSAGQIQATGSWYPGAHAAAIGMTEHFLLGLESALRLSEICRGNSQAVNGPLDYGRINKGDAWFATRDYALGFWDDFFRETDDLSRITAPLEIERAQVASKTQPNWSPYFKRDRWLAFLKEGGWSISEDTFDRRTAEGGEYRKNPRSERGRISLDLNTLPESVRVVVGRK